MARLQANVRKRSTGDYEKRFTVDGKRYSVYGKTQKEVIEKEGALREKIKAGLYTENRKLTLDQWFDQWLAEKRGSTKGNTLRTYTYYYRTHISPSIGSRKVQAIERREVILLQGKLTETLSISTANQVIKTLKVILNDAVQAEIIQRNPADSVKALRNTELKAVDTTHRALTEQEQKDFMQGMAGKFYYELFAFLLSTGMRQGEAAGLLWSDVDTRKGVIHIRRTATFTEDGKRTTGTPKSEAGTRDIPITENVKKILRDQKEKQKNGNVVSLDGYVFTSPEGKFLRSNVLNLAIKRTIAELGEKGIHIEPFTVHALRDTFATRFIEQGGSPQTLKTILGHSSLAMTMDLYAHVLPNTKADEMNRINIII